MRRLVALFLAGATSLLADGWSDLRRSCFTRASVSNPNYWLAECVQELLTTDPIRLDIGTVAPGSGIFAYGLGISHPVHLGQTEFLPGGAFVQSTDGSFLLRDSITFALPTRAVSDLSDTAARFGIYRRRISEQSTALDAKASLTLNVTRMEAKEQDFYGLGNKTARSARSGYSLRLNDAGIAWNNPLFVWSSVGVNADFLQPRAGLSSNSEVPQVRTRFNEATAPALTTYTDFLSIQPYLKIQLPAHRSTYVSMGLDYAFYHSIDDSKQYSFQRFSADTRFVRPLIFHGKRRATFEKVTSPTQKVLPEEMSASRWIREAICWNQRGADYCTIGDLSIFAHVDYAFTSANSTVPFYFQSTLGGTDFQRMDTLRGYGDYRFRAPNRMFGQLEYRHPVWGPIGLLGLYDVGKVALDRSDLAIDHLHHDWGIGLYARIGGREVARIYLGFGTREGTQLHPKIGSLY